MALTTDQARATFIGAIAAAVPGADARAVPGDRDLREALDLDSFDLLQVAIALKAAAGIEVPEADMRHLLTLDSASAYLAARSGQPGP